MSERSAEMEAWLAAKQRERDAETALRQARLDMARAEVEYIKAVNAVPRRP